MEGPNYTLYLFHYASRLFKKGKLRMNSYFDGNLLHYDDRIETDRFQGNLNAISPESVEKELSSRENKK